MNIMNLNYHAIPTPTPHLGKRGIYSRGWRQRRVRAAENPVTRDFDRLFSAVFTTISASSHGTVGGCRISPFWVNSPAAADRSIPKPNCPGCPHAQLVSLVDSCNSTD